MPRKPSPCGTKAAYERHRKNGEAPCEACTRANTVAQRKKRDTARKPAEPLAGVSAPEEMSRRADLERQRDTLWQAIQWAIQDDPARVAALSKELREIWADIEALSESEEVADDPFAKLLDGPGSAPISLAERREMA